MKHAYSTHSTTQHSTITLPVVLIHVTLTAPSLKRHVKPQIEEVVQILAGEKIAIAIGAGRGSSYEVVTL